MAFARQPNPVFSAEYQQVREVLVEARRAAGLSQRDLAAALGKASSHVSMIERGQRRVDLLEFHRIARALRCDPASLYAAVEARLATLEAAPAPIRRAPPATPEAEFM